MTDTRRAARQRFAANIEELRRRRGLSMDALARRSELDREGLARILRGDVEADARTIFFLAGALEIDAGELFDGITWVSPSDGGRGFVVEDPEAG